MNDISLTFTTKTIYGEKETQNNGMLEKNIIQMEYRKNQWREKYKREGLKQGQV